MGVALNAGECMSRASSALRSRRRWRLLGASAGGAVEAFELVDEGSILRTRKMRVKEAQRAAKG